MVLSTHFSQPKLQLSACASDINSTTNCASSHQKASAQSQSARNAALSGGGRQKGGGDPMAGLMTVSQGPASAGGSVPASPTTGNTNMVGTTQTSVGAQAQTQYDSAVNTTGKIPTSSSPRANKNPPPHVPASAANAPQGGGGRTVRPQEEDEEPTGAWITHLNRVGGGGKSKGGPKTKKGKRKVGKKKKQTKKKGKRSNPKKQKKGRGAKIRRRKKAATQIQTAVRHHTQRRKAVSKMRAAAAQRRTQKRRRRVQKAKIRAVGHFATSLREQRLRAARTWDARCQNSEWLDFDLSTVETAKAGINSALDTRREHAEHATRLAALG